MGMEMLYSRCPTKQNYAMLQLLSIRWIAKIGDAFLMGDGRDHVHWGRVGFVVGAVDLRVALGRLLADAGAGAGAGTGNGPHG
jgi:hypothetical protein